MSGGGMQGGAPIQQAQPIQQPQQFQASPYASLFQSNFTNQNGQQVNSFQPQPMFQQSVMSHQQPSSRLFAQGITRIAQSNQPGGGK